MTDPKLARLTLGLNQQQMADVCGVHRSTYVKWERSERDPGAAAIRLIDAMLWLKSIGIFEKFKSHFV